MNCFVGFDRSYIPELHTYECRASVGFIKFSGSPNRYSSCRIIAFNVFMPTDWRKKPGFTPDDAVAFTNATSPSCIASYDHRATGKVAFVPRSGRAAVPEKGAAVRFEAAVKSSPIAEASGLFCPVSALTCAA